MSEINNQNNNPVQLSESTGRAPTTSSHYNVSVSGAINAFFLIIICVCAFRVLQGNSTLSFQSFIEMLQGCPQISTNWISALSTFELNLPGWLSWLSSFVTFFRDLATVGMFFIVALLNVIPFVLYFLRWLIL